MEQIVKDRCNTLRSTNVHRVLCRVCGKPSGLTCTRCHFGLHVDCRQGDRCQVCVSEQCCGFCFDDIGADPLAPDVDNGVWCGACSKYFHRVCAEVSLVHLCSHGVNCHNCDTSVLTPLCEYCLFSVYI
jgi:hypothetical protein